MKKFALLFIMLLSMANSFAWRGMEMKALHIEGRYLCDSDGNHINLHGFGQTYSPYFNGYAWCRDANGNVDWSESAQHNAYNCATWNKEQIGKMLDAGWKVNWLRLHLDPHWSNTPGVPTTGENDISAFSETLLKKYMRTLFIPMVKYAIENGIYVVMRPPGVCPEKISVGDEYHQYLRKVWSIVCSDGYLKNNPYVMFELANEPVNMNDGNGNYSSSSDGSQKKCTEFFQQIVDDIRDLGCNNILWVPGLAWQQNYQGYAKYPIVERADGLGIGYAVHCYPGWYGSDSEVPSAEQKVETAGAGYIEFMTGWEKSISAVAAKSPILVTEMDWAPKKYNNSWGKATTGIEGGVGFGANFRFIMDKTGNVSWMLFTDADKLAMYKDSAPDGNTFLTDPEACPRPCFRWYEQYTNPNFSSYSVEREQHILDSIQHKRDSIASIPWYYPNDEDRFNPSIWETGSVTKNSDGSFTLVTGQYGFGGFQFTGGHDFSKFKYLVVNLVSKPTSGGWSLRLFDGNSYWGDPFMTNVSQLRTVVKLNEMTSNQGKVKVDPSHIYILGFWSFGGAKLNIKDMYVTNNDDYTAGIDAVMIEPDFTDYRMYNLNGQQIESPRQGQLVIRNGRKYVVR